jgi:hypothetical protein
VEKTWETLGDNFFLLFPKKTWMGKKYGALLEMLLAQQK